MGDPLTSPGAAFAAQARIESALHATLTAAVREFLAGVQVISDNIYDLTQPRVDAMWESVVVGSLSRLVERGTLDEAAAEYVARGLRDSPMPSEAYGSARAVLLAAGERGWTGAEVEEQLALALALDTPEVNLVAAARKPRPDMAAALGVSGQTWRSALDALVQTAATGLHGQGQMRGLLDAGFPEKRWVSRRDSKVRLTHQHADGQVVPTGQSFVVGSALLRWPGEYGGPAGEVFNCRCIMVGVRSAADPLFLTGDEFS